MLEASAKRIREMLDDDALVLDIGGWGKPFTRADWVLDYMPYATRGLYGQDGDGPERFSEKTWVVRDICAREPYPFEDKSIDFVICSHTLEDVRDPIWVCSEINRIGRAGYIEVPSRLEEQSYGFQGPWAGWGHHHWMIDEEGDQLVFTFKHHILHNRPGDHFPEGFQQRLSPEERVVAFWWTGGFTARERVFNEPAELDAYLADFVAAELPRHWPDYKAPPAGRLRRALEQLRTPPERA